MSAPQPILVTGAAGQVGGIRVLSSASCSSDRFRSGLSFGVTMTTLTPCAGRGPKSLWVMLREPKTLRALDTCRRIYFGMSVSSSYLEAAVGMGAAAREKADVEVLVNMSQMTVSQMSLRNMTHSRQQRQYWLAEQALNWSGLPVIYVPPTVFLESFFFLAWAAEQIAYDGTIRLPFGSGRTSPVATISPCRINPWQTPTVARGDGEREP